VGLNASFYVYDTGLERNTAEAEEFKEDECLYYTWWDLQNIEANHLPGYLCLCSRSSWCAKSKYLFFSSIFMCCHILPSLKMTKGNTCKTSQILWGWECWFKKIFTGTTERTSTNGRDGCIAVRWSNLLPTLASRIILSFGICCDSWPNIYLFQDFYVISNVTSSLTAPESSTFIPLLYSLPPPCGLCPQKNPADSESHHSVITANILVNRMFTQSKGSVGIHGRGGSIAAAKRWGKGQSVGLHSVTSK
jgi:hypothetical protein